MTNEQVPTFSDVSKETASIKNEATLGEEGKTLLLAVTSMPIKNANLKFGDLSAEALEDAKPYVESLTRFANVTNNTNGSESHLLNNHIHDIMQAKIDAKQQNGNVLETKEYIIPGSSIGIKYQIKWADGYEVKMVLSNGQDIKESSWVNTKKEEFNGPLKNLPKSSVHISGDPRLR